MQTQLGIKGSVLCRCEDWQDDGDDEEEANSFFSESGSFSRCASSTKKQTVIFHHLCCMSPMLHLLVHVNLFGAYHM